LLVISAIVGQSFNGALNRLPKKPEKQIPRGLAPARDDNSKYAGFVWSCHYERSEESALVGGGSA
jgi:hypothetical protein